VSNHPEADIRETSKLIREAVVKALAEFRSAPGGEFYGLSLIMHPVGGLVGAAFATDTTLERAVTRCEQLGYSVRSGDLRSALRDLVRWNCESGWLLVTAPFAQANASTRAVMAKDQDPDGLAAARLVHGLCTVALLEADWNGAFGVGAARERITLNIWYGDQSTEDLLSWARPMNPHDVWLRLQEQLQARKAADARLVPPRLTS